MIKAAAKDKGAILLFQDVKITHSAIKLGSVLLLAALIGLARRASPGLTLRCNSELTLALTYNFFLGNALLFSPIAEVLILMTTSTLPTHRYSPKSNWMAPTGLLLTGNFFVLML